MKIFSITIIRKIWDVLQKHNNEFEIGKAIKVYKIECMLFYNYLE